MSLDVLPKVTYIFSFQSFLQQSHLCLWNKENRPTHESGYYLLLIHRLYKVLCKSNKKASTISAQPWKTCPGKPLQKSAKDIDRRLRWSLAAGRNYRRSWWNIARNLRSLWPNSSDSRLTKLFSASTTMWWLVAVGQAQNAFIHLKKVTLKWNIKTIHKIY